MQMTTNSHKPNRLMSLGGYLSRSEKTIRHGSKGDTKRLLRLCRTPAYGPTQRVGLRFPEYVLPVVQTLIDFIWKARMSVALTVVMASVCQVACAESLDGLTDSDPQQVVADTSSIVTTASAVPEVSTENAEPFALKPMFDSLHLPATKGKATHWYDKLKISGYSQIRFGDSFTRHADGVDTSLFGDRSITNSTGTFSVRRARLLITEDVNEYLRIQFQSDFANNPADGTNTYFAQLRDIYADIYLDSEKIHRFRAGQSKIPWGFEEMQSSGLRVPLDRSDAMDSGDSPNQRDLGLFYYWTPVEKQELLKELVDGGLKGSGNYGIFGLGIYNGQGSSQVDLNRNLHTVARFTWPHRLASGQVVEASLQGYTGVFAPHGEAIQPGGVGAPVVPAGVGPVGLREERLAATLVWYPQPLGFQTEWNVGRGPGLNDAQTAVEVRSLSGGYVMALYKVDTDDHGVFIPFARYQHYKGGYRSVPNAPYGTHDEADTGCEWQISKGLELTLNYGYIFKGLSLLPSAQTDVASYQYFHGHIVRCQMQINY